MYELLLEISRELKSKSEGYEDRIIKIIDENPEIQKYEDKGERPFIIHLVVFHRREEKIINFAFDKSDRKYTMVVNYKLEMEVFNKEEGYQERIKKLMEEYPKVADYQSQDGTFLEYLISHYHNLDLIKYVTSKTSNLVYDQDFYRKDAYNFAKENDLPEEILECIKNRMEEVKDIEEYWSPYDHDY